MGLQIYKNPRSAFKKRTTTLDTETQRFTLCVFIVSLLSIIFNLKSGLMNFKLMIHPLPEKTKHISKLRDKK